MKILQKTEDYVELNKLTLNTTKTESNFYSLILWLIIAKMSLVKFLGDIARP